MTEAIEDLKPRIGVGVVVLNGEQVLLGKRKGAHGEGTWSFAGGHLEYGETIEACAARELQEETGLKALSMVAGPWTNDLIEEGKHYVTLFVFVNRFTGKPQLLEPHKCEGWQWFHKDHLPDPLFPPIISLLKKVSLAQFSEYSAPNLRFDPV